MWLALDAANANSCVFRRFVSNFMEKMDHETFSIDFSHTMNMDIYWRQRSRLAMHLDWLLSHVNILNAGIIETFKTKRINFPTGELGERMTSAFDQISVTIEVVQWYKFPIEIQKILPIIINEAHEPVVLNCYGSTACLRASFKVVSCGFELVCSWLIEHSPPFLHFFSFLGRQQWFLVFYDSPTVPKVNRLKWKYELALLFFLHQLWDILDETW